MKLILGSGSPRRKEIMTRLGYEYEIIKSEKDEITTKEKPYDVVMELSYNKAIEVKEKVLAKEDYSINDNYVILTADTVVAVDDSILGKPKDREDAFNMISRLRGRAHQVYTGVTILMVNDNRLENFYEKTDVYVNDMSDEEIRDYIATGECDDKAGAYAIQGIFGKYIDRYEGSYDNVVGLPGDRVDAILKTV